MILIADSGSTKTHWCLMAANGHSSEYFTDGINPFQQTSDAIKNSVNNQLLPKMAGEMWAGKITNVYFYGAGCTPEKIPVVVYALEDIFKDAKIEVYSDMVGAACGPHIWNITDVLGKEETLRRVRTALEKLG